MRMGLRNFATYFTIFLIDLDFPMGAAFADALYVLIKQVIKETDEEIEERAT